MDKALEEKLIKICNDSKRFDRDGDEFNEEVYLDYRDEIGDLTLAKISKSDNPQEIFDDFIYEVEDHYYDYCFEETRLMISNELGDEYDENEDEIIEWIQEHVHNYVSADHFNENIKVNIALDTGDADSDFTQCNILNWYGDHGYDRGEPLPDTSPVRWLAKQQGKFDELATAISLERNDLVVKYDNTKFSKFTNSMVEELQNLPSHMACMTFLVEMPLFDYIRLRGLDKNETITISKNTMCGLYDPWSGGGSILEVELEKDVELPAKLIWHAVIDCNGSRFGGYGYDISDVYGLMDSAWHGKVTLPEKGE